MNEATDYKTFGYWENKKGASVFIENRRNILMP